MNAQINNQRVQQIVSELEACGNYTQEAFAQQLVGETITAILCTDTRSMMFTTYDKAVVDGIIGKVIDQVRNHWSFR
jgi:hypothetical protein